MNLKKLLLLLSVFFLFCLISYTVVEHYNQKWDKTSQSKKIDAMAHRIEILDYSISILPQEQRNDTWLAGVVARYGNMDPNELAEYLRVVQ